VDFALYAEIPYEKIKGTKMYTHSKVPAVVFVLEGRGRGIVISKE